MASPSLVWLPILLLLLLLFFIVPVQSSESCPESFNFSCPDNVHNGEFSSSNFTTTSLRSYNCGGPCELICNHANHTMIKCTGDDEEPAHQVLKINPTDLTITIAADYPYGGPPPDYLKQSPCEVYSYVNFSFPVFRSVFVLITGQGVNETFFGCPSHGRDEYLEFLTSNKTGCGNASVYGPYAYDYDHPPPQKLPPHGCIQFGKYYYLPPKHNKGVLTHALKIVVPAIGILVGLVIIGLCYRLRTNKSSANFEAFLKTYKSSTLQRYTYLEIKKMTDYFKEKVGQGGFGTVYKGSLKDGRLVAVKLLKQSKGDNGKEFINEVASIGRTNHVNIVALLGFCFQRNKRALVYEFMPNGSLDKFTEAKDHILCGGSKSLTWRTMYEISLGIARGLEYLHRGCQTRILHFDIKPHNILLDENFCPKISDFGLAMLYPHDKHSKVTMSDARGTIGYIAPEVFNRGFGHVSHKSDVYSYGMMVLEVIGSRRRENDVAQTSSSDMYFPQWIYKQMDRDEGIEEESDGAISDEDKEVKKKLILVSLWCIQTAPSSRPSMSRVVQMLEGQLDTNMIPPMPILSSPPRLNPYPSTPGSESITFTL